MYAGHLTVVSAKCVRRPRIRDRLKVIDLCTEFTVIEMCVYPAYRRKENRQIDFIDDLGPVVVIIVPEDFVTLRNWERGDHGVHCILKYHFGIVFVSVPYVFIGVSPFRKVSHRVRRWCPVKYFGESIDDDLHLVQVRGGAGLEQTASTDGQGHACTYPGLGKEPHSSTDRGRARESATLNPLFPYYHRRMGVYYIT